MHHADLGIAACFRSSIVYYPLPGAQDSFFLPFSVLSLVWYSTKQPVTFSLSCIAIVGFMHCDSGLFTARFVDAGLAN
jgi:hypothetical protein